MMKIRENFVSNSSSTSFLVSQKNYPTIYDLAIAMIRARNCGSDKKLINKIKKKSPLKLLTEYNKFGLSFPTRNYRTYIYQFDDQYIVSTCNNHNFECYIKLAQLPHDYPQSIKANTEKAGYNGDIHSYLEFVFPQDYKFWYIDCDKFGSKGYNNSYHCKECWDDLIILLNGDITCPCGKFKVKS